MKHHFPILIAAAVCGLTAQLPAATPAKPDPNFIKSPADLKARIPTQLRITKPDYVVFVPEVTDTGVNDTGNEHFLVFDGPDGSLMAVWTQSSAEAQPDQHIAFSRSADEGVTWSKPRIIAGPKKPGDGCIASWAYPMVSKQGRIYILYSQHIGRHDTYFHATGWLHGIHSDDHGATWSKPQNIPVARSSKDNPDPTMPPNMLCWQKPLRLGKDGKYFAGFTRWTSFAVKKNPTKSWISDDSRVEFMRFENVDDNPEVKDLKINWFATNEKALAVPFPGHPEVSVCQEPTLVKLPDGRLFCVMRTSAGSPFWSVSTDLGETWTTPRRLLRKDGGEPLLQPLSPCPMYDVGGNTAGSGRYALFIHNHDGHYKNYRPTDTSFHRRPIYLVAGHFKAGADQPVWFDEPKFFMDHDGVGLGKPGTNGRLDLALYSSFTVRQGKPVLWYPERKFFLLGRVIGDKWFGAKRGATVPLIYITDLFHPHEDPDDHFDLATLFAIPEFDIRAVVLENGARQLESPGRIPLQQIMHLTGRKAPFAPGLAKALNSPQDDGRGQPAQFQAGVELLLSALRESPQKVTIFTTGSCRDLAAALNREPELLRQKTERIYLNIGDASVREDYNVDLDVHSWVRILKSNLPVYWCSCNDGGPYTRGRGYSTWWQFQQDELLLDAPQSLQNFFHFALNPALGERRPHEIAGRHYFTLSQKSAEDPIACLSKPLSTAELRQGFRLPSQRYGRPKRDMWCTAPLLHAAGRTIVGSPSEGWISVPAAQGERDRTPYEFVPVRVSVEANGRVALDFARTGGGRDILLFRVNEKRAYDEMMTGVLRNLLATGYSHGTNQTAVTSPGGVAR